MRVDRVDKSQAGKRHMQGRVVDWLEATRRRDDVPLGLRVRNVNTRVPVLGASPLLAAAVVVACGDAAAQSCCDQKLNDGVQAIDCPAQARAKDENKEAVGKVDDQDKEAKYKDDDAPKAIQNGRAPLAWLSLPPRAGADKQVSVRYIAGSSCCRGTQP